MNSTAHDMAEPEPDCEATGSLLLVPGDDYRSDCPGCRSCGDLGSTPRPLAFLSSTYELPGELPGGGYEREFPATTIWQEARKLGLNRGAYGSSWTVHESKQDYLDSLD